MAEIQNILLSYDGGVLDWIAYSVEGSALSIGSAYGLTCIILLLR